MSSKEGVIKFRVHHDDHTPLDPSLIREINRYRKTFYELKLIGADNGIGYGNLSTRYGDNEFIITATQTGVIPDLDARHYALVTSYDFGTHSLHCCGAFAASSEALSHAALYECSPEINCILHAHDEALWRKLYAYLPHTPPNAEYGTAEMADEIKLLYKATDLKSKQAFIMEGHENGLMFFAGSLEELLNLVQSFISL